MPDDTEHLVTACADLASKHGIDAMLDVLAGVYQVYAPLSEDVAIKIAWDIASGSDVSVVTEIDSDGNATHHTVQ